MKAGDIVSIALPQSDGKIKNRPVLLLKQMPPYQDWLVSGISSQIQQEVKGFDYIIRSSDPIFSQTRLKTTSIVRLGYLDVINLQKIRGIIGYTDQSVVKKLLNRLADYLKDD
jgi:mRNA interferase MazF